MPGNGIVQYAPQEQCGYLSGLVVQTFPLYSSPNRYAWPDNIN